MKWYKTEVEEWVDEMTIGDWGNKIKGGERGWWVEVGRGMCVGVGFFYNLYSYIVLL